MEQTNDKSLFAPIEKKDWERVLQIMNQYNCINGYVDYDPNGKMQFYDSDPFIGGVHAIPVSKKHVKEIVESFN